MSLLGRLRQMLTPEKEGTTPECPAERPDSGFQAASSADGEQADTPQSDKQARVARLTPREHDLYLLLLEGFTLKESAKLLGIQYSTANTHMTGVYRKLCVQSRAELIINYRDIRGENTFFP